MPVESLPRIRINRAGIVRCEPGWFWHLEPGSSGDFDLWFAWAGHGTIRLDARDIPVDRGCAFCLRPRQGGDGTHDPRRRLGICFVHFDFLDRQGQVFYPEESVLPPNFEQLLNVELHEQMLRRAVALFNTREPAQQEQAAEYVRLVLLEMRQTAQSPRLSGLERDHAERIGEVMRFVRENPGRIFEVSELAQRAAYSVDHFTRVFTQIAGCGPKEYCIRARMERARILLRDSGMTIQQIASTLGYADVFFFSRQFKQQLGMSPKIWRAET